MSVWDKLGELKDTLQDIAQQPHDQPIPAGHHKDQEQVREEIHGETQRVEEIQAKEGWSHKLKDVLDGGEARRKREEEEDRLRIEKEKEEARQHVEARRGIAGKFHDVMDGGKHKEELEKAEFDRLEAIAQAQKKQNEHLSDKILDALETPDELKDKIHELTHSPHLKPHNEDQVPGLIKDEQIRRRDEDWRAKLRAFGHTEDERKEKKKVERSWLSEKVNAMAGGGVTSEANEDKLDKTIDFIQEHVLHQGDQSDESALEQMKDEQISDAIRLAWRETTGHELPVKDKS